MNNISGNDYLNNNYFSNLAINKIHPSDGFKIFFYDDSTLYRYHSTKYAICNGSADNRKSYN